MQWRCPHCECDNLEYDDVEFYDDQCFFPRKCKNCWAEWEERYQLEFIWHENVETKGE